MWSLRQGLAAAAALIGGLSAANAEELGPVLRRIKETGAISLGYQGASVPFSYLDAEQRPSGFAIDLCTLAANKVKLLLARPGLEIRYVALPEPSSEARAQTASVDIECRAALLPRTGSEGDYSVPIFESELRWLVPRKLRVEREGRRRPRMETISPSSASDLRGKAVALVQGSNVEPIVLTVSNDRSLGLSIVYSKDESEAFRLVETGKAAAAIADGAVLVGLKASAKNSDAFGFLDEAYPGPSYGLKLRGADPVFEAIVNDTLTGAMASGEYAALYAKWFESPIPPRNVNLGYPMPGRMKELIKLPGLRQTSQ
jgi:glutamate/aspartate transport system substrate-binding protein